MYVVLIYDFYDNLAQQSKQIDRMSGILYAVCEFESNSWRIARQLICLLQENEQTSDQHVDLAAISKTVDARACGPVSAIICLCFFCTKYFTVMPLDGGQNANGNE